MEGVVSEDGIEPMIRDAVKMAWEAIDEEVEEVLVVVVWVFDVVLVGEVLDDVGGVDIVVVVVVVVDALVDFGRFSRARDDDSARLLSLRDVDDILI